MPRDGLKAIVKLMRLASKMLRIKMFTFDSPELIAELQATRLRGVSVRVLLNPKRSSNTRANDATYETLRASGIAVEWTNPHFSVTHEKSMVVDDQVAIIATFNLVNKHFTHTRDYGLVIDDFAVVQQVAECFDADWRRGDFKLPVGSPLALSNGNARSVMATFIDSTVCTLLIQHPKYSDMAILDRLLAARVRGVEIHLLCGGHHGISSGDMMETFSALRCLARAGVIVRRQHGLRLHSKLLIADLDRGMLGSMNIDHSAFDLRRELGVVFSDHRAVEQLRKQFHQDWKAAKSYDPPDPLSIDLVTAVDQEPDLVHE